MPWLARAVGAGQGVETVFDLMDLDDEARNGLLQMSDARLAQAGRPSAP